VKFARIENRLSAIFSSAGYVVRVCDGMGEGEGRLIGFVPGLIGAPLISVPAVRFLVGSDEQVLNDVKSSVEKLPKVGQRTG